MIGYFQDGRVRDLSQLFQAKTIKIVEDTTKKLRIVEHLQVNIRSELGDIDETLHF